MTIPEGTNAIHILIFVASGVKTHEFVFVPSKVSITILTVIVMGQKPNRFISVDAHFEVSEEAFNVRG